MKKILVLFMAGIFFLIPAFSFSEILIDKIVAVVGDKYLTLYQLNKLCLPFFKRIPEDLPEKTREELKEKIRKEVLKGWIEDAVVKIEAEKFGLKVSDEEVKQVLEKEIEARGGRKNFYRFLKQQGLSYQEYFRKLKENLVKIKLIQYIVHEKVMVTEQELKKAYQNYIKEYKFKKGYELSLLLIHSDRKVAYEIYRKVLNGKSFRQIAKEYSNYVDFVEKVRVKKSELAKEILQELKEVSEGGITPPVKVDDTYEIIKVLKVFSGKPPSFSQIKEYLYKKIYNEKAQRFLEKWIKELEQKRYIRIYL